MTTLRPLVVLFTIATALPSYAEEGITVTDAYARSSSPMAQTGAAFMRITNATDQDDRLVAARSDIAQRVELHTHLEDANGVMRMIEVEDGFMVPSGETHELRRGGDHIMFMGIAEPFEQGETIPVTLVFENQGEITIEVPVDLERQPAHGEGHQHGKGHGG